MAKTQTATAASACAPFCTEEDVAALRKNAVFNLARKLRAASNNTLFVLPTTKGMRFGDGSLFLGSEHGFPALRVRYKQHVEVEVSYADFMSLDTNGHKVVETSNVSYALRRTLEKAQDRVRWFCDDKFVPVTLRQHLFHAMKFWLEKASERNAVKVGTVLTVSAETQQYLIRNFCKGITQDIFPANVLKEINEANDAMLRTRDFTASTLEQANLMFAREKWMLVDMGTYLIAAAVDMTSCCDVAQKVVSENKNVSELYYGDYLMQFNPTFTVEPRAYRSWDAMPEEIRNSIRSSFAFVKAMVDADDRVTNKAPLDAAFLGLPVLPGSNTINIDGGWIIKDRNPQSRNVPIYGQIVFMDKD